MRAGQRDRRLEIQAPSYTRDPVSNAQVEAFATVARVWGQRKDTGGSEFLQAGGTVAQARALFWIPWRPDLTTKHRLRCEGLLWNIEAFRELAGRRRYLEIQASAAQANSK